MPTRNVNKHKIYGIAFVIPEQVIHVKQYLHSICSKLACQEHLVAKQNMSKLVTMETMMGEKIRRIYVDTSVVNGAFAQRFAQDTKPFWNAVQKGMVRIIVSDILEQEVKKAPQHIRDFLGSFSEAQFERIVSTNESDALAEQYVIENVVGQSSLDDCKHIALATLANADVLVSWNFKHIVNDNRIRGYNSVNMKLGYPQINIRTPYEVINDET
jgi:predicted nucleic acid-binding protein